MIRVDGDIVAWRASSATDGKSYRYRGDSYESIKEMTIIFGKEFQRDAVETVYEPEPWSHCKRILDNLMEDYGFATTYVGGKANFRYKVATIKDYKGNRTGVRKPEHIDDAKQYLCDGYDAVRPRGPWETDDEITLTLEEGDTLVTLDKDFKQFPNIILKDTISLEEQETTNISALRSLYEQVLIGDVADNIPGCYNCGAKAVSVKNVNKAKTEEEMFEIVMAEYKKRYHKYAESFMTENMKLLYLLRQEELQWVEWLGVGEFYRELKDAMCN